MSSDGRGVPSESIPKAKPSAFVLELNESKVLLIYNSELGYQKGNIVATVQYSPQIGVFPKTDYVMKI